MVISMAAPTSMPRMASAPYPVRPSAMRLAQAPAPTAIVAIAATVMNVPSPIMKVDPTPTQNRPCAKAKTRTRMAPEHGRKPTATMAEKPRCQPLGPASSSGSGAWACPQAEASQW
jgi:hypothetical protein